MMKMNKRSVGCVGSVGLLVAATLAGAGEAPLFAKPPTATKVADSHVKIEFAVDRETDVAVYILDGSSNVVRHLAAGVLGTNAPAPLKKGSLQQSIDWDGRNDDGEPAKGEPFKVRVAAGLTPKHDGFVFGQPEGKPYNFLETVWGIGVAPDGGVYAIIYRAYIRATGNFEVQRFTRDGIYDGTLAPFGGQLKPDDVRGYAPLVGEDGRVLPRWVNPARFRELPYLPQNPLVQTPIVDGKGRLRMLVGIGGNNGSKFGVTAMGPDGSVPGTSFSAALAYEKPLGIWGNEFEVGLALSDADPETVLLAGMKTSQGRAVSNLQAVFRVSLAGDGKMVPVFGDAATAGSDETHLKDPISVATDGKGNVYVADTGNGRIVAFEEKSGKFLGAIPVPEPHWVGVHRGSGAVYVHSGNEVLKFSGLKDAKIQAKLALPKASAAAIGWRKHLWVFALDSRDKVARLWMGQCNNPEALRLPAASQLMWCDDLGDRFSAPEGVKYEPSAKMTWAITSDPTHRYVVYRNSILDDRTGEIRTLPGRRSGETLKLGPGGLVYALPSAGSMDRCTLDGKKVPFSGVKPGNWMYRRDEKGRPYPFRELEKGEGTIVGGASIKGDLVQWPGTGGGLPICGSGTSGCERDFTIDRAGNIYVKNRGRTYHGEMIVDVYDRDGQYLRTAIWSCSDGAYGPRLDAAGNIYMAEGIVRGEDNLPPELKSLKDYSLYYASLVKFSPKGGAAWHLSAEEYAKQFGFKPPDLGMRQEKVTMITDRWIKKDKVLEGAEWWRPGFSVYQNVSAGCHCFGHLFDTDDFGRSFHPDTLRFRLVILDSAGNEILHLGSYGNRDNRGSYSWVRDPKTQVLRPRRADDPKDLVSPYAQPEFAFGYLNSVAVTDRHIYALDAFNNRVMKIRMDYAAEATLEVK